VYRFHGGDTFVGRLAGQQPATTAQQARHKMLPSVFLCDLFLRKRSVDAQICGGDGRVFSIYVFFFEKIRKLDLICFRFSPYKSDFGSNVMVLLQLV
jgi:hypothetical protein